MEKNEYRIQKSSQDFHDVIKEYGTFAFKIINFTTNVLNKRFVEVVEPHSVWLHYPHTNCIQSSSTVCHIFSKPTVYAVFITLIAHLVNELFLQIPSWTSLSCSQRGRRQFVELLEFRVVSTA